MEAEKKLEGFSDTLELYHGGELRGSHRHRKEVGKSLVSIE